MKKTCAICKYRVRCIVYHSILDAYSEILIAEIANGNKTDKWLKEILRQTAEICEYYKED